MPLTFPLIKGRKRGSKGRRQRYYLHPPACGSPKDTRPNLSSAAFVGNGICRNISVSRATEPPPEPGELRSRSSGKRGFLSFLFPLIENASISKGRKGEI